MKIKKLKNTTIFTLTKRGYKFKAQFNKYRMGWCTMIKRGNVIDSKHQTKLECYIKEIQNKIDEMTLLHDFLDEVRYEIKMEVT